MFSLDYRNTEYERHRRLRDLQKQQLVGQSAAARRKPRRLLSPVGRALITVGERLAAEPMHEQARPR